MVSLLLPEIKLCFDVIIPLRCISLYTVLHYDLVKLLLHALLDVVDVASSVILIVSLQMQVRSHLFSG